MLKEIHEPKKVFSLGEANKTLPLVSRIIQDIVRTNQEMCSVHERARALAAQGRSSQAEREQSRVEDLGSEMESYFEELEKIGCSCKDPVLGLVDFPARIGNRIVLLCWKLGEPEILFYHEVKAGFSGRKPVGDLFDGKSHSTL